MSDFELMFQLFALLLGLAIAQLLSGLARSWRIGAGAVRAGEAQIRIGWLVPLFGLLVLIDLTRFWVTAYALRDHLTFDYASLLAMLVIIGGYFAISTFVIPDEPADWPDFDDYFLRTNRTVVGGMIVVNCTIIARGFALAAQGVLPEVAVRQPQRHHLGQFRGQRRSIGRYLRTLGIIPDRQASFEERSRDWLLFP